MEGSRSGNPGVSWCPDTQDFTKLSVIPIEIMLICTRYQFSIPVVTEISGLLLILCNERHDYQLKMHYKAFGSARTRWGSSQCSPDS